MKKKELEKELDDTKKEVKNLKRELNKLRKKWKSFDKVARIILSILFVFIAWEASKYIVGYTAIWILGYAKYTETLCFAIVTLITYLFATAIIIFVPKLVNKAFKTTKEELGLNDMPTFVDIGLAALGYIATFVIAGIVIVFLDNLNLINASESQSIGFSHLTNGTERVIAYLSIAVIAPIFEEVVFRGWLYGKLRKELKFIPAAIIVSTLFGILHGQLNVGINVGILSMVMCFEREITGTIHAGIITHMIQNSIAFALLIARGII